VVNWQGPWGTGPYKLTEGFSRPDVRSDRIVLEANLDYWDSSRFPRIGRIIFDNTLGQKEAVELVKSGEGRVDLVTELSPLDTLRVAQSPFATVIKNRQAQVSVFGLFNMKRASGRWRDARLRQAVNYAIHRADLIRYATKGNGVIIPALLPAHAFGYDPDLKPYPFDPAKAQALLQQAGYSDGLTLTLIAPRDLEIQATVVSKMLEQSGFTVIQQVMDSSDLNQKTLLVQLNQPPAQQSWDIALTSWHSHGNFAVSQFYHQFALGGMRDWVIEEPDLRRLYEKILNTVDREQQVRLLRQMERHTRDQAYFLFLYNPIQLFAVNKAVTFVPYVTTILELDETSLTEQHWSRRKQKAALRE
jgi:ABC-type transport system substrate-binding protein